MRNFTIMKVNAEIHAKRYPLHSKLLSRLTHLKYFVSGLLSGLLVSSLWILTAPVIQKTLGMIINSGTRLEEPLKISHLDRSNTQLKTQISTLKTKMDKKIPKEPYLIVDSSGNRFRLMTGKSIRYESICSTGSYTILKGHKKEKWIFQTPRGLFRIQNVILDPVWRMPDWAFVEEGLPVPAQNSHTRYERGVLGDYAFDLGKGYLIHGTLYKRFLGMPVTHGCIRLGDDELKMVYKNLHVGSKVFIY